MITFKASFDDGCELDLRVAGLLEQYDIKDAIFYVPLDWVRVNRIHGDIPLRIEDLRSLSRRFKIGSHTVSHPMLTRIPADEILSEVITSKNELGILLGVVEIEDFCYPRGYANDDIRDLVREHYKTARNTLVGNLDPPEDPAWESTTVHVAGVRRKEYEGTTWLDEGLKLLNEAVERSKNGDDVVYHFWGHSWEIERYSAWGDFEKLLMEIKAVRDAVN